MPASSGAARRGPGRPPVLGPAAMDEAMGRIEAGEPIARVARAFELRSRRPLYYEAQRRGILRAQRRQGRPPIPAAKAAEVRAALAELGGNVAATARQTGVARSTVRKYRDQV